jgi:hypothetical protein
LRPGSRGVVHGRGQVILGGALEVVVFALGGLVDVAALVLQGLSLLVGGVIGVGRAIVGVFGAVSDFLFETLPDALGAAWDRLGTFFDGVSSWLSSMGESLIGVFASIGAGIRAVLTPVVDFFSGVVDGVRAAFRSLLDFVVDVLRHVPAKLLPDSLVQLTAMPSPATAPQPVSGAPSVPSMPMPAAVEASVRARDAASLEARVAAAGAGKSSAPPPVNIALQVDGETLARAAYKADRDVAARSFSPVPTY